MQHRAKTAAKIHGQKATPRHGLAHETLSERLHVVCVLVPHFDGLLPVGPRMHRSVSTLLARMLLCCRALVSCRCAFVPPAAPSLRGLPQRPRKASVRACPHPVQRGRSACGHGAPAGLVPRAQCVVRVTIRAVRVARQGVLPLSGCIHRCRCVTPSASTAQSSRSKVVPGGLKV